MFPEYRDFISQLKHSDYHFSHLYEMHHALDQRIKNMETHLEPGSLEEIGALKKKKLLLKDQLYAYLQHKQPGI